MIVKPLANLSVLLVEDNEMNTLLASAIIQNTRAKVTQVDNGIEAIRHLQNHTFDLILMDLHLPVMDGFATTRYIRKHISKTIPIIAVTANVVNGEEQKCLESGMNGFLPKPYTENELLDTIADCIPFENGVAQKCSSASSTGGFSSKLYDLSFLKEVSKGNHDLLEQMIQVFIEQAPVAVKQLRSAYYCHDFSELFLIAHRMKPDIDNLDIISLKEDIRKIESMAKQKQNGEHLESLILNLGNTINQVVQELQMKALS